MIKSKLNLCLNLSFCLLACEAMPAAAPSPQLNLATAPVPQLHLTAQEAYAQMLPLARSWQPDAQLYQVESHWLTADGRSSQWHFYFVSPQGELRLIQAGQLQGLSEPPKALPQPLTSDTWLDSDEILRRIRYLPSRQEPVYQMRLSAPGIWQVQQGLQWIQIDAQNGRVSTSSVALDFLVSPTHN